MPIDSVTNGVNRITPTPGNPEWYFAFLIIAILLGWVAYLKLKKDRPVSTQKERQCSLHEERIRHFEKSLSELSERQNELQKLNNETIKDIFDRIESVRSDVSRRFERMEDSNKQEFSSIRTMMLEFFRQGGSNFSGQRG